MDAFYASVEILDFPELKDKPVVVGGSSNRGVVSAASYRAREFGVRSAMPVFQARILCPDIVIRPGRMKRYLEVSRAVIACLQSFSPLVEQISIDEAYVDLGGTGALFGTPENTVLAIKDKILKTTGLTCSVGLSTSKLVAKIASDMNKPAGITIIPPSRVRAFLDGLPVGKIPGIGRKNEEALNRIGIKTLSDIRKLSLRFLEERFGKFGSRLRDISRGEYYSPVVPYSQPKSVSNEVTLDRDTDSPEVLGGVLLDLTEKVGRRLRKHGFRGRTVTLKLKDSDHRQITRSVTLDRSTQQGKRIYEEAMKLLAGCSLKVKKRLIGVGVSNLEPAARAGQISLFEDKIREEEKWDRVDRAVDDIVDRFGSGALKRGRLRRE
ncbi:MAG: DNA polymerase IV [Candidatus Krumholzibacteriota bacterium]|nr:DNA polymerase IV [Candidatus Krumholzibacteriota bacterium]